MSTRRERVILDLEDNLTGGLARAAVAAKVLDRELKSMGRTSVKTGRDLDKSSTSVKKLGDNSRNANKEIDKFSGRLQTLAEAAFVLGPALVPIGATAIPVLTAAIAGLGSAAGALGVTVLAFHGLGDALKAIDKAHTEPTAENLQAMRVELEKLGPAGAEFARYLDNLRPILSDLQNTARGGMFPGLEDGINALLTRGPEVTKIINRLSHGMGDLARDAGKSLSSDAWTPFFNYVKTDANPTLQAFGHAAGNVALGLANMLVAFAPLSRDFTGGLEDATKAFADWSAGLADNQSFQDFVDYIRESGPKVIDFLAALGGALSGLIQAAAPFGQIVLPALTGMAKAFALIAKSPIGPGLYAAAAGMVAFNRAASIAEKTSTRFSATWAGMSRGKMAAGGIGGLALLATSLTDVDDKAGMANTTMLASAGLMVGGPWGLAIGAAVGQVVDLKNAYDDTAASINTANDAMRSNDTKAMAESLKALNDQLDKGHPGDVTLSNYLDAVVGSFHDLTGQTGQTEGAIAELKGSMKQGGDVADLFGETIGQTGNQLRVAAGDADAFSGALARLNGWFDKRDAVRGYKDAIDELRKSMKDGFTREDAANLDNLGKSILQVANNIKSPKVRNDFLASARAQLVDMAEHSGPKAAAAIQEVIDKFDDKGLTHPKPIELSADDHRARTTVDNLGHHVKGQFGIMNALKADPTVDADDSPFKQTFGTVKQAMAQADRLRATAHIDGDNSGATSAINQVSTMLRNLNGDAATVYVHTVRNDIPLPGQSADGGTIPKTGKPYADRHLYMLADGEEVISNRHGQADRHRSLLKAINAGRRMSSGGTTGHPTPVAGGYSGGGYTPFLAINDLATSAHHAAESLKALKKHADTLQKAYDKAKQTRDDAVSRRDSLSGTIQSSLMGDSIWADTPAVGGVWGAGSTPGGKATPQSAIAALNARTDRANRFVAALNTLKGKGVTGAALQEILSEGLEATEAMAAADLSTLSTFSTAFNASSSALAAAGLAGGNAVEGQNVTEANKRLDRLHDDLQEVKKAIKAADDNGTKATHEAGATFTAGVNGAAHHGHKRGR